MTGKTGGGRAVLALRVGILARLVDAASLARTPDQVARRSAAVLRHNDADHPQVWLLGVDAAAPGGVLATGPAVDPVRAHAATAHALAVGVAASGSPSAEAVSGDPRIVQLHAVPVREPGSRTASLVLVVGCPTPRTDSTFADYLATAAAVIGAGWSGLGELAVERQNSELLRQLDAAKSTFLANVSHELRTPISLITGPLSDTLAEEAALTIETRRRLQLVRSNANRLNRMVDAMLDFSRMEAGRIAPEPAEVALTALLRSLAAGFGPAIERAGLTFHVRIADLPSAPAQDALIIERIVLNLLANALKYTPSGSVTLELRASGTDFFEIAVTDTGIGIPVTDHDRVFERFEQVARRDGARSTEGAGIGLAMVKELSELLGGSVALMSAPGRGSTFTVRLPYRAAVADVVEGARTLTPRRVDDFLADVARWEGASPAGNGDGSFVRHPAASTDGRRERLLVVDDNPEMRSYLADALGAEYEIELAADGLQALAAARRRPPQAILADVMMPGLDGFGMVAEIRADPALANIPVLLVSARAGQDATLAGLGHGADDYLVKPFSIPELRARLASNIQRAASRTLDAGWRRAVLTSMHEALVIADADGLVTEVNDAFTRMLGFTLADGPFRPPYPWWPDPDRHPDDFARIASAHSQVLTRDQLVGEYRLRRADGRPVWGSYQGGVVDYPDGSGRAVIKTIRDVTREHWARRRRADAARVAADFADATQLEQLVDTAIDGLSRLFDGEVTVQLGAGRNTRTFTASGPLEQVPGDVAAHVRGDGGIAEPGSPRPGVLLAPATATGTRAWVAFGSPRTVAPDEEIVADLLAQALSLAVERVLAVDELADKQANLERAVESHRMIGQAVGILVERHRISPPAAFQRLRQVSKDRNLRLRTIAEQVIETGAEPEDL